MILLVTTSSRAKEYAAALERGTGHKTQLASSLPDALEKLEKAEYEILAVDQVLLECDSRALDTLLNRCGSAMPVHVNLSLQSSDRTVREVQAAMQRVARERRAAESFAGNLLRNELRSEVTGILLNSELALASRNIAPEVADKLKSVRELAQRMRSRLEIH